MIVSLVPLLNDDLFTLAISKYRKLEKSQQEKVKVWRKLYELMLAYIKASKIDNPFRHVPTGLEQQYPTLKKMVPKERRPGMKPDLEVDSKMMPLCAELRDWGLIEWATPGGWPSSFIQDVLYSFTEQIKGTDIDHPLVKILFTECEVSDE